MSIIAKLKTDFLPKVTALKSVVYNFENGESETVFFRATANAAQTDKYLPLLSENKIEGYVELILARALNQDGSKMFAPKDKVDLMKNVDPEFLTEIGNAILGVDEQSVESEQKERQEIAKK